MDFNTVMEFYRPVLLNSEQDTWKVTVEFYTDLDQEATINDITQKHGVSVTVLDTTANGDGLPLEITGTFHSVIDFLKAYYVDTKEDREQLSALTRQDLILAESR